MTIRHKASAIQSNKNHDYRKRHKAEIQRGFVEFQFKSSELEQIVKSS